MLGLCSRLVVDDLEGSRYLGTLHLISSVCQATPAQGDPFDELVRGNIRDLTFSLVSD